MATRPRSPLTIVRAVQLIVAVTVTVVLVSGLVVWLFDRADFPDIGLAWWWSLQTATTVGYGDVVPRSTLGRSVGALLMIVSTAFLTTVTAAITSSFVDRLRRLREQTSDHMGQGPAADLRAVLERLDQLEAALHERDRRH